jgi:hypothetical protein
MTLSYLPAVAKGQLHKLEIDGEKIETTRAKEVLDFAKSRLYDKSVWKELKEAVRLGKSMTVTGGGILS